jgi:hypothetical protein
MNYRSKKNFFGAGDKEDGAAEARAVAGLLSTNWG